MITDQDSVIRQTGADAGLATVICSAVADNFQRIPLTREGGYIATDISEDGTDETMHIILTGHLDTSGIMMQGVEVIWFETMEKANRFRRSPEGQLFDDPYGDGQDGFEYSTYAGNPIIPALIHAILTKHFGITEASRIVANTYANIHYFRKDPDDIPPKPMCC